VRKLLGRISKNKKGETLVETITAFLLISIELVALTTIIMSANRMNRLASDLNRSTTAEISELYGSDGAAGTDTTLTFSYGGQDFNVSCARIDTKNLSIYHPR